MHTNKSRKTITAKPSSVLGVNAPSKLIPKYSAKRTSLHVLCGSELSSRKWNNVTPYYKMLTLQKVISMPSYWQHRVLHVCRVTYNSFFNNFYANLQTLNPLRKYYIITWLCACLHYKLTSGEFLIDIYTPNRMLKISLTTSTSKSFHENYSLISALLITPPILIFHTLYQVAPSIKMSFIFL